MNLFTKWRETHRIESILMVTKEEWQGGIMEELTAELRELFSISYNYL